MAENEKVQRVKETLAANKGKIILVGSVAAVVVGMTMVSSHNRQVPQSSVGSSHGVQTDATKGVNSHYQNILNKDDNKNFQQALKANHSGQAASALPSIVGKTSPAPNESKLGFSDEEGAATKQDDMPDPNKHSDLPPAPKTSPVVDLPLPTPPKPKPVVPQAPPPQQAQPAQPAQVEQAHDDTDQQMNVENALIAKIEGANSANIGYAFHTAAEPVSSSRKSRHGWNAGSAASLASASTKGSSSASGSAASTADNPAGFKQPAVGTVMDAEMSAQVTSYNNGPVFATVTSGKYEGARLIGKFSVNSNQNGLQLTFNQMTIPYENEEGDTDVQTVSINAIGVSQGTMSNSMATEVNHHFLLKASYQLASSFMQGLGQAIQQSGSTATSTSGGNSFFSQGEKSLQQEMLQAGGNAASQMQSSMQDFIGPYMNTEITIDQGTPFQIVFMGSAPGMDSSAASGGGGAAGGATGQ